MLDRLTDAMCLALESEVVDKTDDALRAAAESRAVADEMAAALARSRSANAKKLGSLSSQLKEANQEVKKLRQRVQYLENVVASKQREIEFAKSEPPVSSEELHQLAETRGCSSAEEARSLLSSLILYTQWSTSGDKISTHSCNRKEEVLFHEALDHFLEIVASSESAHSAPTSTVMHAYAMLWRSVASPGRKGWRGEIIHAALTLGNKHLFLDALVNPDTRFALQNDLRMLQTLYNTTPNSILDWLLEATGPASELVPPKIPLYGAAARQSAAECTSATTEALRKKIEEAQDWGNADLVLDLIRHATNEESHLSSIADRFYGLRWRSQDSSLDGILAEDEVKQAPQHAFVGVEDIRERLCKNTEFLLNGLTAQNVLLYGGPGTGKSSMVRSLLKDYGGKGLRLIEVEKDGMSQLPELMETLSSLPHKFIIFLDDLTFEVSSAAKRSEILV